MSELIRPQKLPEDVLEKLEGANLNLCLTCGTCSGGCPITGNPAEDMQGWDTRKVIRMLALGMLDEVVNSRFPGCAPAAAAAPPPAPWAWTCRPSLAT